MTAPESPPTDTAYLKDTIEHLRTVHFTLAITCFALFATTFLARRGESELALEQLREISVAVAQRQERWPEALMGLPAIQSIVGYVDDQEKPFYVVGTFEQLWTSAAGELVPVSRISVDGELPSAPTTLREVASQWDRLKAIQLFQADVDTELKGLLLPTTTTNLDTVAPDNPNITGFRLALPPAHLGADSVVADIRRSRRTVRRMQLQFPLVPIDSNPNSTSGTNPLRSLPYKFLWIDDNVTAEYGPLALLSRVTLVPVNDEHALQSFALRWPELSSVGSRLAFMPLSTLEANFVNAVQQGGEVIELFGTKVPIEEFARWGSPVLIAIQLYFLLHLRHLTMALGSSGSIPSVPWIGAYREAAARWVSGVSLIAFPPAVILTLLFRGNLLRHTTAGYLVIAVLLTSAYLGWLTFRSLLLLWKSPAEHFMQESV
jgi:hypothetical protein